MGFSLHEGRLAARRTNLPPVPSVNVTPEADRSRRVAGHNRWHPDVEPVAVVRPGDVVSLDAPLGTGDQIGRESVHEDLLTLDFSQDLLAGPVYVEGAEPGDVLAVELLEVEPADFGFSAILPGFGFLADVFPGPYLVTWELDGRHARSAELPGIAVPGDPFPGTIGVAPSRELLEQRPPARGGVGAPRRTRPVRALAACRAGRSRRRARDAAAPRDRRQSRHPPPRPRVAVCSCRCTCRVRCSRSATCTSRRARARSAAPRSRSARAVTFRVNVTLGARRGRRGSPPSRRRLRPERRYLATTGISIADDGRNELLDVGLAARRALLELVDYLAATYGFTREAAYVLASVAAELRISQVVDLPNALVSALLPLDVFEDYRSPA